MCKYVAVDLSNVGGQRLFEETATAKETPGQQVIYTVAKPIKKSGGIAILRGDLALEGYMIKLPGSGNEEPHDGVW